LDIYLIRHGEPDYDLDVLTERGRDQAEKTSEFLKDECIDLFFDSPLGRAKETSKRTLEKVGKKAKVIDFLSENYLSPYTTKKMEDGSYHWYFWIDEFINKFKELGNRETWVEDELIKTTELKKAMEMENENVDNLFISLGIKHDRKTKTYTKLREDVPNKIAIFAHGGMAYAFLSSILDITYPEFVNNHKCLDFCGIAKINITFDKPNSTKEEYFNKLIY